MAKDPNDARMLLKVMRTGKFVQEGTETTNVPAKEMSTHDMLKITRNFVNEDVSLDNSAVQSAAPEGEGSRNVKTKLDQKEEEQKLRNFFDDMNVHLKLAPIIVKDDKVFWEGVIDGVIQFIFKITGDDDTSGVKFQYLKDGYENSETSKEIVKRILSYYDTFYKYWEEGLPND
jgi:hypothetical protein